MFIMEANKTALVTGVTGQDGSYLTELLLAKGYVVYGLVRRTSSIERSRLTHLFSDDTIYGKRLFLNYFDFRDLSKLRQIFEDIRPAEVYHLAGQSHVGLSFELPEVTYQDNIISTLNLLEIIRSLPFPIRFLHASSSEIFGSPDNRPQDESTCYRPVTPYGCSKACATQTSAIYREFHKIFVANCIMYNHESPRRGENFVTRKICRAAAEISLGLRSQLPLGDIDAKRDWGHAKDYVRAMWLALQNDTPLDYVISSGSLHSVKDILESAFGYVNLDWRDFVVSEPRQMRISDPQNLVGDSQRAHKLLGWHPSISFEDMIHEMVGSELALLS